MLVRSEVIDDSPARLAVDHRRVKSPTERCAEVPDPGHRLAAEGIAVRVVVNGEGDIAAALRKHDPAPGPHVQKRERVRKTVPHALHDTAADGGAAILTREAEAPLDLRVQPIEIGAERPPVDRGHFAGGSRRQRDACGRSRPARSAIAASPTIATPSGIGWNGPVISAGTSALVKSANPTASTLLSTSRGRASRATSMASPSPISNSADTSISVGAANAGTPIRIARSLSPAGARSLGPIPW